MELRQLNYFLKAKELLNFTEAASHLHISQSTLSQQIKQLEDEVGVPLFDRIGKRIRLTEAGQLFAAYAARTVNAARDGLRLLDDLSNLNTGHLVVGLTYGLRGLVIPAVNKFAKNFRALPFVYFSEPRKRSWRNCKTRNSTLPFVSRTIRISLTWNTSCFFMQLCL